MPPKVRCKASVAPSRYSAYGLPAPLPEGDKPADMAAHFAKLTVKQKQQLHESITGPTRFPCPGFLENLNANKNRAPIPINEKRRVKVFPIREGDTEYVPATYAKLERDDYILWQAPTKDNYVSFWRSVWQDGVKLIVSLSDKFSENPNDCYPYWPMKESSPLSVQGGRFVVKLLKKIEAKGFSTYELEVTCSDPVETPGKNGRDKSTEEDVEPGNEEGKNRKMTVIHFENWTPETWPNVDNLATCIYTVAKREVQLMRKTIDQFTPPVLIQGHNGIGRTGVAWVGTILMKDIEKKDCFDIPDLIHKFMRLRPGSFTSKLYYCLQFAVGFRCAALGGWMSEEEAKKYVREIEASYKASK